MSGKILVTGGAGQLASALGRLRPNQVVVVGRPDFDFDRPESIAVTVAAHRPALVINAAAWTAVDAAESAAEGAARANHTGPALLALACRAHGARLIHVSTDYVFDGNKGAPYVETDAPSPTGIYGATKLAGEGAVLAALPQAVILRTAWVYAREGKNFVLTMLNAARRAPRLRVVGDQIGCPTNADDLAAACLAVADRLLATGPHGAEAASLGGIYHATGQGETSWHGFAEAIFASAARHGWPSPPVDAIATADWPTPARRPPDSRLDCSKLARVFGVRLPPWQPSLDDAVAAICQKSLAAAPG
jgi:dTDP-4-dehydrorhamnose reductase